MGINPVKSNTMALSANANSNKVYSKALTKGSCGYALELAHFSVRKYLFVVKLDANAHRFRDIQWTGEQID